jgi:hypothetical protein
MGTVNGNQGEFDFNSTLPGKAFPIGKAVPYIMENKPEPDAKPVDEFYHFEPLIDGAIADYSAFPPNRMYIAQGKNILTAARPPWVPPFEYRFVYRNRHIPPVRTINSFYYVKSGKDDPLYYKLSLDGFAAVVDYYVKYGKALNKREAEEQAVRLKEKAQKAMRDKEHPLDPQSYDYRYYASVLKGTHKTMRPAPLRLLSATSMTLEQSAFFKENGIGKKEMWAAWREIRTSLEQKLIDMSCQYDDLESSYTKGAKTSYGDAHTNNALFEEFGILVKRQNGDAINRKEIGEIKNAFDLIKPVFGNLKPLCAEYGLKVSHSGVTHMHASKFIGVFFDMYRAIGVRFGDTVNGPLTLAHELSHFLDSRAGKETEHFFSSDRPGSIENSIAGTFRAEMNRRMNSPKKSKYFQRTCECFARAMEQFSAFMVAPVQYLSYCKSKVYVPDTPFQEKLLPLIAELITERQGLWHKGETGMKNSPEVFKVLELQADRETADYHFMLNIGEMDDDFLEKMSSLARNRQEEYARTIDRYKNMETLPGTTLELLKESRRAGHLGTALEREYRERLKNPDSPLFPIYPADITSDRFKEHIITLMKSERHGTPPLQIARLLIGKASPRQRDAISGLLKREGCVNEETTLKLLKSWTGGEAARKPKKDRGSPETGISA